MPRCSRCQGCMILNHEERYCINCGARSFPPTVESADNSEQRWRSIMCERCHAQTAMEGWPVCEQCRNQWPKTSQPLRKAHLL